MEKPTGTDRGDSDDAVHLHGRPAPLRPVVRGHRAQFQWGDEATDMAGRKSGEPWHPSLPRGETPPLGRACPGIARSPVDLSRSTHTILSDRARNGYRTRARGDPKGEDPHATRSVPKPRSDVPPAQGTDRRGCQTDHHLHVSQREESGQGILAETRGGQR